MTSPSNGTLHAFPAKELLQCTVTLDLGFEEGKKHVDYIIDTSRLKADDAAYLKDCILAVSNCEPVGKDQLHPDQQHLLVFRFNDYVDLQYFCEECNTRCLKEKDKERLPHGKTAVVVWEGERESSLTYQPRPSWEEPEPLVMTSASVPPRRSPVIYI